MRVSVIIPCYNYGMYLEDAIKSVLDSTYNDIEVIVVDDGSNDLRTLQIIDILNEKYPDIIFLRQENKGLPAARNTGIQASTGDFILPLDADDMIDPTFIEKAAWVLTRYNNVGIVYCYVQLFGTENYVWKTRKFDIKYLLEDNYIPATAMFPKKIWRKVGGYDESFRKGYEDWEYWLRIAKEGYIGYRLEEILFFYRKHGTSMLSESNKVRSQLVGEIKKKYRKNDFLNYNNNSSEKNVLIYVRRLAKMIINSKLFPDSLKRKMKHLYYKYNSGKKSNENIDLEKSINRMTYELKTEQNSLCNSNINNILIVLPWLEIGGVERVYLELIEQLSKKDIAIHLFTTAESTHPWHVNFSKYTNHIFHLNKMFSKSEEQVCFLLDYIQLKQINIVQISNSSMGYALLPLLKKHFPLVKVIDHLHMEEPYEPWDYFRLSQRYETYIDIRVVLTETQRTTLIEKYHVSNSKIKVIPNGIDVEWATEYDLKEEGIIKIAFIGRIEYQKNPIIFIEICKELVKVFPDCIRLELFVVGDGGYKKELIRKIKKYKLTDRVRVLPFTDNVKGILKEIDILIAPSIREGMPMIGLEAMATGVVVVANNVAGWNDLIVDNYNGFLVDNNNINSYVSKILMLTNSEELRHRISKNAISYFRKNHTSEKMADHFFQLY